MLTRREFFKIGTGAIISRILGSAALRRVELMSSRRDKEKRDDVISGRISFNWRRHFTEFRDSNSAELMHRYVVGFTPMLLMATSDAERGGQILKELVTNRDELYKPGTKNRHRIQVFPACAAAHLLPVLEYDAMEHANNLICQAMVFPQRELQEILPQNMISALTVSPVAWRDFWVTDRVLEVLRAHLTKVAKNPFFVTGANLVAQFFVLYQSALYQRLDDKSLKEASTRQLTIIDAALNEMKDNKHMFASFQRAWVKSLCEIARDAGGARSALPPQSSELVMGWRNIPPSHPWYALLPIALLNNALLVHLNYQVVNGRGEAQWLLQEYGREEAEVALQKGKEWFRNMRLPKEILLKAANIVDGDFKKTVLELSKETSVAYPSMIEWDPYWSLVPFRSHLNPQDPRLCDKNYFERIRGLIDKANCLSEATAVGSFLAGLGAENWKSVEARTPDKFKEATRPTGKEIQQRIADDRLIEASQALVEGDSRTFNDIIGFKDEEEDKI